MSWPFSPLLPGTALGDGPQALTLECEVGSFSLTGQTQGHVFSVVCAPGLYTFTGRSAILDDGSGGGLSGRNQDLSLSISIGLT